MMKGTKAKNGTEHSFIWGVGAWDGAFYHTGRVWDRAFLHTGGHGTGHSFIWGAWDRAFLHTRGVWDRAFLHIGDMGQVFLHMGCMGQSIPSYRGAWNRAFLHTKGTWDRAFLHTKGAWDRAFLHMGGMGQGIPSHQGAWNRAFLHNGGHGTGHFFIPGGGTGHSSILGSMGQSIPAYWGGMGQGIILYRGHGTGHSSVWGAWDRAFLHTRGHGTRYSFILEGGTGHSSIMGDMGQGIPLYWGAWDRAFLHTGGHGTGHSFIPGGGTGHSFILGAWDRAFLHTGGMGQGISLYRAAHKCTILVFYNLWGTWINVLCFCITLLIQIFWYIAIVIGFHTKHESEPWIFKSFTMPVISVIGFHSAGLPKHNQMMQLSNIRLPNSSYLALLSSIPTFLTLHPCRHLAIWRLWRMTNYMLLIQWNPSIVPPPLNKGQFTTHPCLQLPFCNWIVVPESLMGISLFCFIDDWLAKLTRVVIGAHNVQVAQ